MSKLPSDYFLMLDNYIETENNLCFKLLRKIGEYEMEDTNLSFDCDNENEALQMAWIYIDHLEDGILDEPLIVTYNK